MTHLFPEKDPEKGSDAPRLERSQTPRKTIPDVKYPLFDEKPYLIAPPRNPPETTIWAETTTILKTGYRGHLNGTMNRRPLTPSHGRFNVKPL